MDRDQAVDIVAQLAAQWPRLQGEASKTVDGWVVRVRVANGLDVIAHSRDEAALIWRGLLAGKLPLE